MTKKLSIVVLMLSIIYLFTPETQINHKTEERSNNEEIRGIFVSYIELKEYIGGKSKEESENNIKYIIKNIKEAKLNTIYLQVRSHMDSIYESNLFPTSKNIILNDKTHYDVLKKFIEESKKENIDIYAWINPYRIGNNIDENSKYYEIVKNDIKLSNNNYYLNPASKKSTQLIVDGVEEIVKKYNIKGILFDDYFYPDLEIDIDNYNNSEKNISLEEFRLNNVSNMVLEVNKKIKSINKNILFGISPDGNIENNYNKEFADVKKWVQSDLYIDFIMPQIYYGFENETKPFERVLTEWNTIINKDKVKYQVALAFYKTGREDTYAKKGKEEWLNNNDIMKREVLKIREAKYCEGFSFFRYDNLFNEELMNEISKKERLNLKKIM